jgi:hypothetical protein
MLHATQQNSSAARWYCIPLQRLRHRPELDPSPAPLAGFDPQSRLLDTEVTDDFGQFTIKSTTTIDRWRPKTDLPTSSPRNRRGHGPRTIRRR